MGASSSSMSDLASNEYLLRLSGTECITANDPFWNQLLSFSFQVPKTSADQRLLEETTSQICKNFAINNCQTGNFNSLVTVFLMRATELKSSAQCQESHFIPSDVFTWQTYNALFIIRNLCKYFMENLSEEVILQQFDTRAPGGNSGDEGFVIVDKQEAGDKDALLEELINSVAEILVDVPILEFTYSLHLECLNTLLTILSIQMYQVTPASQSQIYRAIMGGKCCIHACVLMKTLLQNYIKQMSCPKSLSMSDQHGALYNFTSGMASGLWSVMTLGMSKKDESHDEKLSDALLANQSLVLILVLVNTCTNEQVLHNPYREALFSFTNNKDESSPTEPTQTVATFKVDLSLLYKVICDTLKDDQVTLLLYLLLHQNSEMKSFILSRTNTDDLIVPILKILYAAQEKNSHHIYMALIILLILSEDEDFNRVVHECQLKNVTWFKERHIAEISLGGLLILVLIRTIQYNMTRMKDKYLHTNCLAALANMSAYFKHLHPYVAQRIVSLFALLLKKHSRLIEMISQAAMTTSMGEDSGENEREHENDHVEDLAILEEVIRMVLEIINSCLTHSLPHNPHLVYTLLYQQDLFTYFRTHPTFQDIIQNIDTVLSYFTQKLEVAGKQHTVQEVQAMVNQGVQQFHRDKLKKFPELKFKYVEEEQPEEFFVPYVWSLVYYSANLYFNASRIQIFSIHSVDSDSSVGATEGEGLT